MERHGHIDLASEIRAKLLSTSAATTAVLRRGSFVHTLVLTDIATGWTECARLQVREQKLSSTVLTALRKQLPFALLGLDTDNDSVFMNETLKVYCNRLVSSSRAAAPVARTIRPSWSRRTARWSDEWSAAVDSRSSKRLLCRLSFTVRRLFVNVFQPSFKLMRKERNGARVHKTYSAPATPHQRLVAEARTPDAIRASVDEIYAAWIRSPYCAISSRAGEVGQPHRCRPSKPSNCGATDRTVLSSLRIAWKEGAVRPTDRPSRDPLVNATPQLGEWFEAEPWRTVSERLRKLQAECPGLYPS